MHFIDLTGAWPLTPREKYVVTAGWTTSTLSGGAAGDLVTLKSSVNRALRARWSGREGVGGKHAERRSVHVASAYLVFVAMDEHGRFSKVSGAGDRDTGPGTAVCDALAAAETRRIGTKRRQEERQMNSALGEAEAVNERGMGVKRQGIPQAIELHSNVLAAAPERRVC